MSGLIALLGSGAYLDTMNELDQYLLIETHCRRPKVMCVPTAAAPFGGRSIEHYTRISQDHFRYLGVQADVALVTNRAAANDPRWVEMARAADLIYFSGGNPLYLCHTLAGSPFWAAVYDRWYCGAAIAGSSAGAIMLAQPIALRPLGFKIIPAFGLVTDYCVWPHFDLRPVKRILTMLADQLLTHETCALGIDENTALVGRMGDRWQVSGAGRVTLLTAQQSSVYANGSQFTLPVYSDFHIDLRVHVTPA